jgi:hypothetical protein
MRRVRVREEVLEEGLEMETFAVNVSVLVDDGLGVLIGGFLFFLNLDQEPLKAINGHDSIL